jgi:hypothetical protein
MKIRPMKISKLQRSMTNYYFYSGLCRELLDTKLNYGELYSWLSVRMWHISKKQVDGCCREPTNPNILFLLHLIVSGGVYFFINVFSRGR